jgi:DMSO/TMAO reductase YedYZ molybdopterin-dependent catalytic subunit
MEATVKKPNILTGALVGGLLTAPLAALFYLGNILFNLTFVPFDIFEWMTRVLPGPVITFGIDLMIDTMRLLKFNVADTAKLAEQVMAIIQFLVMGIAAGAVFFVILKLQNIKPGLIAGLVLGALFGFPAIAIGIGLGGDQVASLINLAWMLVLYLVWGLGLISIYARLSVEKPAGVEGVEAELRAVKRLDRRKFLITLGTTSAAITVVGSGLGALLSRDERGGGGMGHEGEGPTDQPFPNSDDMVIPVPGTRPEYTPIKDHYQVFIELEPTEIDGASWKLPITGLVDNPLMLTLDDLRDNYEPVNRYITLSCISGRIGTSLISTTYWTGARVSDVLADAGVQENARYLYISSGDGFYESVPLDLINSDQRIMFCYEWDGNTLPVGHGFPLRIWLPDRFGMKQPKWITAIEVTDTYKEGYWVERNWSEDAIVRTTSVIDTVAVDHIVERDGQRFVPVGGIAFAGARGISKVEVRVDEGDWGEANLRQPLSETTWVIWRYEWPFQPGDHTFEVRCYDGTGELQVLEENKSRPDGATGIHSLEAQVQS